VKLLLLLLLLSKELRLLLSELRLFLLVRRRLWWDRLCDGGLRVRLRAGHGRVGRRRAWKVRVVRLGLLLLRALRLTEKRDAPGADAALVVVACLCLRCRRERAGSAEGIEAFLSREGLRL
jgi:hypothetical protein